MFDWRVAFYVTGLLGVLWLIAWWALYRHPDEHPKLSAGERAWIQQDPADPGTPIGWRRLLGVRETWSYALGNFRSEEHTSELQYLMRISYAVFFFKKHNY